MENPRQEKVAVVDELKEHFQNSGAVVVTEYRGLSVSAMAKLRSGLRSSDAQLKIFKNTLARLAANETGNTSINDLLVGPTALAFVKGDSVGAAKALKDFSKEHPALLIKGGLLGGKALSPSDIDALAALPSREVLLARFAGGLAAPMTQMAGLLQALPRNFAYGLKALADKKAQEAA